jgi:hypothetical protein
MTDPPGEPRLPLYRDFEALGEQAYDEMYEGRVAGRWSDIKEYFSLAIGSAERAGLSEEADRLRKRFDHIRKVVRSQFS